MLSASTIAARLPKTEFFLRYSKLRTDRLSSTLKEIAANKLLTKVTLTNCSLVSEQIKEIMAVLSSLPLLEELDLSHNFLDSIESIEAFQVFLCSTRLKSLNLIDNNITYEGAKKLVEASKRLNRPVSLKLVPNNLSLAEIQQLKLLIINTEVDFIEPGPRLSEEIIERKDESLQGMRVNSLLLKLRMHPVRKLILSNCLMGDGEIKLIASEIERYQIFYLNELDLSGNDFTSVGISTIATVAEKCRNLKIMKLNNNKINSVSADCLVSFIRKNQTLEELHLASNEIDDKGAISLAQVLPTCTLQKLDISGNKLEFDGIHAIHTAVERYEYKIALDVRGNLGLPHTTFIEVHHEDVSASGDAFISLIKDLNTHPVRKIKLINCALTDEEVKILADLILKHQLRFLEEIDLSANKITDAGLKMLVALARHCKSLRVIIMAKNQLTSAGMEVLIPFLKDHPTLSEVDFSKNLIEKKFDEETMCLTEESFPMDESKQPAKTDRVEHRGKSPTIFGLALTAYIEEDYFSCEESEEKLEVRPK